MLILYLLLAATQDFGSSQTGQKEIKIGSYNLPQAGENLLERIQFTPVQLFSDWTAMQELFWFPVDPYWYNLATQIRVYTYNFLGSIVLLISVLLYLLVISNM